MEGVGGASRFNCAQSKDEERICLRPEADFGGCGARGSCTADVVWRDEVTGRDSGTIVSGGEDEKLAVLVSDSEAVLRCVRARN